MNIPFFSKASPPTVTETTVTGAKRKAVVQAAMKQWPDCRFRVTQQTQKPKHWVATRDKKAAPIFPDADSGPISINDTYEMLPGGLVIRSKAPESGTPGVTAVANTIWSPGPKGATFKIVKGHAVATLVDKTKKQNAAALWANYWAKNAAPAAKPAADEAAIPVESGTGVGADFDIDNFGDPDDAAAAATPGNDKLDLSDFDDGPKAPATVAKVAAAAKARSGKPGSGNAGSKTPANSAAKTTTAAKPKVDPDVLNKEEEGNVPDDVKEGSSLGALVSVLFYDKSTSVTEYMGRLAPQVEALDAKVTSGRSKTALKLVAVIFAIKAMLTPRDERNSVAEFDALFALLKALKLEKLGGPFTDTIMLELAISIANQLRSPRFGDAQMASVIRKVPLGETPIRSIARRTLVCLFLDIRALARIQPADDSKSWTTKMAKVRTEARVALTQAGIPLDKLVTSMLTRAILAVNTVERTEPEPAEPADVVVGQTEPTSASTTVTVAEAPAEIDVSSAAEPVAAADAPGAIVELEAAGDEPSAAQAGDGSGEAPAATSDTVPLTGDDDVAPAATSASADTALAAAPPPSAKSAPSPSHNGDLKSLAEMEGKTLEGADVAVDPTRMIREGSRRPDTHEIIIEQDGDKPPLIMIPGAIATRIVEAGGSDADDILGVDEVITLV